MMFKSLCRQYWKSLSVVLCVLYLSFASPGAFNEIPVFEIPHLDKIVHFLIYTLLSMVLIFDFTRKDTFSENTTSFTLVCLGFPIILGGLIEIFQQLYFYPRTAEWLDWFSDIFGVFLGWALMTLKFVKPKKNN